MDRLTDPVDPARSARLPEPEDPRDLPTPAIPVDPPTTRRAPVTKAMHTEAAMARFADAASRPALWVSAVLVAAVFGWYAAARHASVLGVVAAAVVGLVLVPFFSFLLGARLVRRIYPPGVEAKVDISGSGVTMTVPKGSFHADWDRFRRADIVRDHLFLRMRGSAAAIILPPELYAGDGALEVARAGIRAVGPKR